MVSLDYTRSYHRKQILLKKDEIIFDYYFPRRINNLNILAMYSCLYKNQRTAMMTNPVNLIGYGIN